MPLSRVVFGALILGGGANHRDVLGAALRQPHLAGAAVDLAHVGAGTREGEALEALAPGIEAEDRVAAEVADPDLVAAVDPDRVGPRAVAGQAPLAPAARRRIVDREVAAQPFADPDAAAAVAPDAARALSRVGGSTTIDSPVLRSIRAMNEPASEHHQMSPPGVVQMP